MITRLDELREQFERFHADNPDVYELFVKFTRQMMGRGHKHYAVAGIFERIRWEKDIGGDGETQFKINNNYKPFYSRMYMEEQPWNDGFFRTRIQTTEAKQATTLPELTPEYFND